MQIRISIDIGCERLTNNKTFGFMQIKNMMRQQRNKLKLFMDQNASSLFYWVVI